MKNYLELLKKTVYSGEYRTNRTDINTIGIFGATLRFDLENGFPLITTKKMPFNLILGELLWFLQGGNEDRNLTIDALNEFCKNRIWDEWADENGNLGPIYGVQWRKWLTQDGELIDQLDYVRHEIIYNPYSRRHIVSAWNLGELEKMALAPCHIFMQFNVTTKGRLDCMIYQRSCDMFLGVPFNIASYALLTHIMARATGLRVGTLIWNGGDVHIYENHIPQVEEQLSRIPYKLPNLIINKDKYKLDNFEMEDFVVTEYKSHPAIKAEIAI